MGKIKCPQCGTVYDGNFCPSCGEQNSGRKKKRKWLLPVIIVAAAVLLIAGIGGNKNDAKPAGEDNSSIRSSSAGATEQTPETTGTKTDSASASGEITIEETELYNSNGVVVTATKYQKGVFGPEISFTITNETDRNITVSSRNLSVNGYMLSTSSLYSDVAAGKKAIDSMTLMSSELSAAGIETVAQIEFTLALYDSDTFEDIDNSDLVSLTTSAAEGFTQPVDDSGDVLYDANGIRVICKGLKEDAVWDGCIVFFIENNNGKAVSVYSDNMSVNGFMVDDSLWCDLRANTRCIDAMYLLSLDDIGVESMDDVENVEFTLRIIDEKWNDIAVSDVITLNFE